MSAKAARQAAIGRIIGERAVSSQPQLVDLLADEGIVATQATVSRDLEDLGAVKVRVPGGEERFTDLSGARIQRDVEAIVGFSKRSRAAGDKVWGRRAATPAFMETIEWTVNEFKTAGLKNAAVEPFAVPGPMWVPQAWKVDVIGDQEFGAGTGTVGGWPHPCVS